MHHTSSTQTISWIQEQYRNENLTLRPPFQRKPVWSDKQRCALIESALMQIPIPEVYVQVVTDPNGKSQYGVVDGQQRLRTILQFIGIERDTDRVGDNNNNFTLNSLPPRSPFKNFNFSMLEGEAKAKFYRYEICVRQMFTENQSEIEDVFKRLNKFTMPLKAQELRNATYHGPFACLSEQLADDDFWVVNKIVTTPSIRRMADIEMISDLLIGLLHGPQGGAAKIIDQYYENYEVFDDEFPDQNMARITFSRVKELVEEMFPKLPESARWGNRADFYSLFVALGDLLSSKALPRKNIRPMAGMLELFGAEVTLVLKTTARLGMAGKYAKAIEKGSNDRARRLERHQILIEKMSDYFRDSKKK